MLQLIHRNRKSVGTLFIVALVCLMMSGFGLGYLNERPTVDAIAIDDHKVSFTEFDQQRRVIENQYRRIFGKDYYKALEAAGEKLNQQVVDKIIDDTLIRADAGKKEMYVGDEEVVDVITHQLFPGGYDANSYSAFLRDQGMTSAMFEEKLRQDLLRSQYVGILRDASLSSRREALAALTEERTAYNVDYAELDANQFKTAVPAPTDEDLAAFYEKVSAEFELPERVSYQYVVFDPQSYLNLVPVQQDDLEVEYADNQTRYTLPEKIDVRHIQITYPKNAAADVIAAAKTRAEEALAQAQANEPFEKLVAKYSDDIATKLSGGSLGWITRGKMSLEFDKAAFALKNGGISDLVTTASGFEIIKVEHYQPSTVRPMKEVQAELETEIRKREAPAFVAEKAQSLFDVWSKSDKELPAFATENKLELQDSKGLVAAGNDPSPDLKGLTARVLSSPDDAKQLIEIGDRSFIIGIREHKESEIPKLAEVKDQVTARYRESEAKKLAEAKANELVKKVRETEGSDLKSAAAAMKITLKTAENISREKPGIEPLSNSALQKIIFSTNKALEKPDRSVGVDGKYYVVQVRSILTPQAETIAKDVDSLRQRQSGKLAMTLVDSIQHSLRSKAKIDVNPSLLNVE